jgi:transposase-like protein
MKGKIEADETFIGGLAKNMHKHVREWKIKGTGGSGKEAVLGIVERSNGKAPSRVKVGHIPNVKRTTLQKAIHETVESGATLYTDALKSYLGLGKTHDHQTIDHAIAFVEGNIHTNSVENFWSLLKRTLKGTYVSVDPLHLDAYLDEQAFRFNERGHDDGARFRKVVSSVAGRRLTYAELTGKNDTEEKPH